MVLNRFAQSCVDLNKQIIQDQARLHDALLTLQMADREQYVLYREAIESWIESLTNKGETEDNTVVSEV